MTKTTRTKTATAKRGRGRPAGEIERKNFSFYLSAEIVAAFEESIEAERKQRNRVVEDLLEAYVKGRKLPRK